ncbi:hypothetical protein AAVH_04883 [Aphelenchoides avenae]|nr:hypothetical protein AAVH_04883 [Aphelenchus avenae]
MDEADIRYYLNHANVHFQSQGFTALAALMVNEKNEKRRKECITLLFDCLSGKSRNLAEWSATLIQSLKNSEEYSESLRLESSTVVDEVLSRLDSAQHKPLLIELLFKVVRGRHIEDTQLANEVIKLVLRICPKLGSASSMISPLLKRLPIHM